ncbi:non-hydrolyzing UDP-N-acetylglucosamine 2-epimerase [Maribellus maritimus]|uniref:non-hydrolyzing UDP-N-acetylglucosamine 2-epimerase n=1 Tax=Maribellus maritimus TaxID=2870838 RepID=UPI001EEC7358|nr:UDP-N-acetylglucosamine 2-epimerase (non-hydrolyzing) [Maribellus maritimus]MCG6188142.1 UDP-N-acetylglucosamine 2-epimerase (non-hydrolyzing) [Maribellus maritimus]
MKKILSVFGTRPEAIKMAPVVKELERFPEHINSKVCVTAQHREMLDQVLDIFDISPDYDLDIMKPNQDLFELTSRVLLKMRDVLDDFQPDVVLVHGDTTSSSTAALAAFYKQIHVGHVEAGLRTGNIYSPWPEEMNRKMTGALATYHFAPTETAKTNLLNENINPKNIKVTGNTVIDALFTASAKIKSDVYLKKQIKTEINKNLDQNILKSKFILVTGHRRENFGEGFIQICSALKKIAEKYPEINIIYPVHLNPNVQKPVFDLLGETSNIHLISPLSYLPFIYMLEKCYFVITDSGGIQEEAPSFGKPVLVMRDTTERPEAVEAGTVKLVGTDKNIIFSEAVKLIENTEYYKSVSSAHNPYGDGKAAERIVENLK